MRWDWGLNRDYGTVHGTSTGQRGTGPAGTASHQPHIFPLDPKGWERLPGPWSGRTGPVQHQPGDKQEDHNCGVEKAFSQIRDHVPGPSLPDGRKHKREKPQEEEAAWAPRHEGRAGQKHPSFPEPGRRAPGWAAARSALACASSTGPVVRLPASRCAGRSRQPLPPFGEGAGAVASLPKGHRAPAAPSGSHLLLLAPVPSPSPKLRCI